MNNAQILGVILVAIVGFIGFADTCMWLMRRDRPRF